MPESKPSETIMTAIAECGYEVKTMTNADLLERLDDQGLYSKAERIQMIKDAAAEIRRLRAGHGAGREYTARDHFLNMTDQSNWPDGLRGDALTAYREAMDMVHEGVLDFWPELQAKGIPVALERTAGRETDHPDCRTDRERELYDALMGLASHAAARHRDFSQWTQGGVTLEPIVRKALRLDAAPSPDDQPAGCESAARSARIAIDKV